jgi:hypothetical protein
MRRRVRLSRTTLRPLSLLAALAAACGGEEADGDDPAPDAAAAEPDAADDVPVAGCATDGTLRFALSGAGLSEHEGRTVTVFVAEPSGSAETPSRVAVRSEVVIADGAFTVDCPTALLPTLTYAYWGAYLDVDEDGRCTGADLGALEQYFGWVDPVVYEVPLAAWMATDALPVPVGSTQATFCAEAFPGP